MEPVCGGKRTTGIESRTVVTSSGNADAINMVVDSNKESRHSIIEIGECSKTAEFYNDSELIIKPSTLTCRVLNCV
ncbi:hypothetical protein LguiA_013588 [Lonicera macranthoides]